MLEAIERNHGRRVFLLAGRESVTGRDLVDALYLTRNVARRFQRRWSLVGDPSLRWAWRQVVGGSEVREPCRPGEVEFVHDRPDAMVTEIDGPLRRLRHRRHRSTLNAWAISRGKSRSKELS